MSLRFCKRTYPDPAKYGVKNGQRYEPANGANNGLTVIDAQTYSDVDDVVVRNDDGEEYRIDVFKLAMVRYMLKNE